MTVRKQEQLPPELESVIAEGRNHPERSRTRPVRSSGTSDHAYEIHPEPPVDSAEGRFEKSLRTFQDYDMKPGHSVKTLMRESFQLGAEHVERQHIAAAENVTPHRPGESS